MRISDWSSDVCSSDLRSWWTACRRLWAGQQHWRAMSSVKESVLLPGLFNALSGVASVSLIVFPAIDLKGGQVVRLAEGDMDRATVYGDNPAQQATLFAEAGAGFLHVVDLDGAFAGRAVNAGAVESIIEAFPGHVQLGGGIRERAAVERWFDLGVSRVVIGTAALKDPEFVKDAAREFPGGIVVAVDARDGFVATEGWAERSDMPVADMARRFEDAGVAALLFTDVGRDGLLKGCNVEAPVTLEIGAAPGRERVGQVG